MTRLLFGFYFFFAGLFFFRQVEQLQKLLQKAKRDGKRMKGIARQYQILLHNCEKKLEELEDEHGLLKVNFDALEEEYNQLNNKHEDLLKQHGKTTLEIIRQNIEMKNKLASLDKKDDRKRRTENQMMQQVIKENQSLKFRLSCEIATTDYYKEECGQQRKSNIDLQKNRNHYLKQIIFIQRLFVKGRHMTQEDVERIIQQNNTALLIQQEEDARKILRNSEEVDTMFKYFFAEK